MKEQLTNWQKPRNPSHQDTLKRSKGFICVGTEKKMQVMFVLITWVINDVDSYLLTAIYCWLVISRSCSVVFLTPQFFFFLTFFDLLFFQGRLKPSSQCMHVFLISLVWFYFSHLNWVCHVHSIFWLFNTFKINYRKMLPEKIPSREHRKHGAWQTQLWRQDMTMNRA